MGVLALLRPETDSVAGSQALEVDTVIRVHVHYNYNSLFLEHAHTSTNSIGLPEQREQLWQWKLEDLKTLDEQWDQRNPSASQTLLLLSVHKGLRQQNLLSCQPHQQVQFGPLVLFALRINVNGKNKDQSGSCKAEENVLTSPLILPLDLATPPFLI